MYGNKAHRHALLLFARACLSLTIDAAVLDYADWQNDANPRTTVCRRSPGKRRRGCNGEIMIAA